MPKKSTDVLVKNVRKGMKNLKLRCIVLDADPIVDIFGRQYRLYRVADETARINVVVWDDAVRKINNGDILKLTRLYCTVWRNRLTMFTSKYTKIYKQGKFFMTFNDTIDMSLPVEDESLIAQQILKYYSAKSFLGFGNGDELDTNYACQLKLEDADLESMISDDDEEDDGDYEDEVDSDEGNENVIYSKLLSENPVTSKKIIANISQRRDEKSPWNHIEESVKRKISQYFDFDELEPNLRKPNKSPRQSWSWNWSDSMHDQIGGQDVSHRNKKNGGEDLDGMNRRTIGYGRYGNNDAKEGQGNVDDNKQKRENIRNTDCIVSFGNKRADDVNKGQSVAPLGDNKLKEKDTNSANDCNAVNDDLDDQERQKVPFEKGNKNIDDNVDNPECSNVDKEGTDKISAEHGRENASIEDKEKCQRKIINYYEEADADLDQYIIVEMEDKCEEQSKKVYIEKTHSVCVEGNIFDYVEEIEMSATEINDDVYIDENIECLEVDYETSGDECDNESEKNDENFAGFTEAE